MPYFNDDGTEFNPGLIPKSGRCVTCKKNDNPGHEIPCNLTRADQDEDIFICFDYKPNSPNIDGQAVLREMENYLDQKYGKHGEKGAMPEKGQSDSSWDLIKSQRGNLPKSREALNKKYQEWAKRDWVTWLKENLTFPFMAKRKDDEDDAYFTDIAKHEPFRLGHTMRVIGLESQDHRSGIIVKVRERHRIGYVPLFDLEVTPKDDPNFWPVREYVVWDANK